MLLRVYGGLQCHYPSSVVVTRETLVGYYGSGRFISFAGIVVLRFSNLLGELEECICLLDAECLGTPMDGFTITSA